MNNKTKVLIVTQEMHPYLDESTIANIARQLPQHLQEKKLEIRILMPRFGTINERRHRLHEVVRLSGINIIIDEDDFPLIIKVASLPKARMQVYFLDNDDFFRRKYIFRDNKGNFYKDNASRMIFFCKGVLETVRKFGWSPDIIHCHGWMTSLLPLYVKTAYKTDPIFENSKMIYSLYNAGFEEKLGDIFYKKAQIKKVTKEDLAVYMDTFVGLNQGAIHYADGVIKAEDNLSEDLLAALAAAHPDKAVLEYEDSEDFLKSYKEFYHSFLEEEEKV